MARSAASLPSLPSEVDIREVGPRDGLQSEAPVAVVDRVRLVDALSATGLRRIEAVSFVSPSAVPAMADAAAVMAAVDRVPGVQYVALVPNLRGAQLAVDAGVDALNFTVSASPAYNERNVGRSIDESLAAVADIVQTAGNRPVDVTVSCAFGSPYEGDVEPASAARVGAAALDAGATSLTYADTTGMATPRRVAELIDVVGPDIRLHLHETRGTGLVNAYAALLLGVAAFDTSVGGLGGSPFAAGAGGNLATEGLVAMLDDLGVTTGVDLDALLAAAALLSSIVGRALPSPVAAAGPRSRLAVS
jgi:hydroxymethylglutaryl-CoA lyase